MRSPHPRFKLIAEAALADVPTPDALVEGVLSSGSLSVLVGAPGSFKTFLALDLSLTIASGESWLGKYHVKQGPVIYVAAEGGGMLSSRVRAWKAYHRVRSIPGMFFLLDPVQFHHPRDVEQRLDAMQAQLPEQAVLVVFDSLARCCLGGDENTARDMGLLVSSTDTIRRDTGAAVLLVHHTGTKSRARERGSSALRGGA